MPQLNFQYNFPVLQSNNTRSYVTQTPLYFAFNIADSISWVNFNIVAGVDPANTVSIGLYSITGSTLSLANSVSMNVTLTDPTWASITATSATQNITPGTWYFGINAATGGAITAQGQTIVAPGNAFPGGFIGGVATATTNGLPASVATSSLDITGNDAMFVPYVLLTA